jgi:hypothetical protein
VINERANSGLPSSLRAAVGEQFARAFHPPYEIPIVVAVNGLLMTGAWFLLPDPNPLFTFHGALAFPMVLAAWMFSDVPATNVLGSDARRSLLALDDPPALRRLLFAKNIVLWMLIAPFCSVVAVVVGAHEHRYAASIFTLAWIVIVPLGALGPASWVGIRYPYHPIDLTYRWEHRRPFGRMIVRWLTLAVLPYGLVPLLAAVISLPTLVLWYFASQSHGITRISDGEFALGVSIGCVIAIVVWIWSIGHAIRLAVRRKEKLTAFLSDPAQG